MTYRQQILEQGYIILKNVFSLETIDKCRNEILSYISNHKTLANAEGIAIPDFIKKNDLSSVAKLKENEIIQNALKDIFNDINNYRFCQHNDIGINRIVGWHKDKLNGNYAKYETVPIWNEYQGEKHEIIKVLTYLEDHSNDDYGLKLVPASHLKQQINAKGWIQLKPQLGDVIIFDQRITHRGMEKQVTVPRILVSFGFGKNNIFTDNFEKGTIARQNDQNKSHL